METTIAPFSHKAFRLPLCDCTVCCMLDDGFFYPHKLTGDPHTHLAYELHYCEEGSYSVILSQTGKVLTVQPGWVLVIPPGCYHCAQSEPAEGGGQKHRDAEDIRKYTLRFQLEQNGDTTALYEPLLQVLRETPVLTQLTEAMPYFPQIHAELRGTAPYGEQAAELALQSFFLQLFRRILQINAQEVSSHDEKAENDGDLVRYERIIRYLDDHYAQPITEKDLADYMHLSVRQISRIFSVQFGATFRQVLGQLRLHQARKLLSRTVLSVEEIAAKVGYGSPSAFYAAFNESYAMSPHQYRLHARKTEENLLI